MGTTGVFASEVTLLMLKSRVSLSEPVAETPSKRNAQSHGTLVSLPGFPLIANVDRARTPDILICALFL
jgi:hypothetical protein